MNKLFVLLCSALLLPSLTSCFSKVGKCNKDAPEVVRALSLGEGELKALLNDTRKYYEAKEAEEDRLEIPLSVHNLSPEHMRIEGRGRIFLYLKACGFDSKVIMVIDSARNEINMSWGDYGSPKAGSSKLWPKT